MEPNNVLIVLSKYVNLFSRPFICLHNADIIDNARIKILYIAKYYSPQPFDLAIYYYS